MADGGDGSLEILSGYFPFEKKVVEVDDPLGRKITAEYFTYNNIAFIELAKASGLVLLSPEERNPLFTSTTGTGQLIADAIQNGIKNIYLFLGGSSTNDAGMGIAHALGFRFKNKAGSILSPVGKNLLETDTIFNTGHFDFNKINITLLCDVENPLFGPQGAAFVYARQKGANDEEIMLLDRGLRNISKKIMNFSGMDPGGWKGSGAAGGIGACLVGLAGAKIVNGFETMSKLTGLEAKLKNADLVISGEGKLDASSFQGKVVGGLSRLCRQYEKPLILLVGQNDLPKETSIANGVHAVFSTLEKAGSEEVSLKEGPRLLEALAFDIKFDFI